MTIAFRGVVGCMLVVGYAFAQDPTNPPPQTPIDNLGGPGESCRTRADCQPDLDCIETKCVNPNALPPVTAPPKPPDKQPQTPPHNEEDEDEPTDDATWQAWQHFALKGVHPFVGLTLAAGGLNGGYTGANASVWGTGLDNAFLIALRAGVFIQHHEVTLEIAPFTYFWDWQGLGPAFDATVSYAYFVPLTHGEVVRFYYPLRFGVGVLAGGSKTDNNVFLEGRLDVVGFAVRWGHLMFDFHLPAFRYGVTNASYPPFGGEGITKHLMTWLIGVSASYVF